MKVSGEKDAKMADCSDMAADLSEIASHVVYERHMMHFCGQQVGRLQDPSEIPLRFAVLEAFLIHCRNLQDFLAPRPSARKGDVTVGLFLDEGLTYSFDPAPTRHRDMIDKHLSHITEERSTSPAPRWLIGELVEDIESAWAVFLVQLTASHPERAAWFTSDRD